MGMVDPFERWSPIVTPIQGIQRPSVAGDSDRVLMGWWPVGVRQ
jgi:hypothetical protein